MNNLVICYFSASGVTKKVAEKIRQKTNGDLFEIEPINVYTKEDLDWTNKESRSTKEMNNRSYRPKVKNKIEEIGKYNKVVIGFPVWWYTAPTIVNTFIEDNNFEDKEIYVFVTSGGSGVDGCLKDLKNTYQNLNFVDGRRIKNEEDIDNFTKLLK